ncbi:pyocin knob domain-containing S74 family peptidase [Enterobacter asburiae]
MSDIFTGAGFKLYYNEDTANKIPDNTSNVYINELAAMPVLSINSSVQTIETYDSEYVEKLLSEQDIQNIDIRVNYLADNTAHAGLDAYADSQKEFQLILQYNVQNGVVTYSIINGSIAKTEVNGGKDAVLTKTYSFVPTQLMVRMATAELSIPVVVGMYGLGSNGDDIPQYAPDLPEGNSFIKVPAEQIGNPTGSDMMGIGLIDGDSFSSIAMTKTGTLGIFAKNKNTAWTRILTATQISEQYVPLSRTVNGKPLSTNITLDKSDVGLSNVLNETQLVAANNLSDLPTKSTARTNLDVYSTTQVDTRITAAKSELNTKIDTINTDLNTKIDGVSLNLGTNYVPKTTKVNGKMLSTDINITKADVGLGNVTNDVQLKRDANLSDVASMGTTRANLGIEIINRDNGYSFVSTPDFTKRLILGNNGDWGLQDASNGSRIALSIGNGGTESTTVEGARKNLQAFYESPNLLAADKNLDTINGLYSGAYRNGQDANATPANNYPVRSAGSLVVFATGVNGTSCVQTYTPYGSPKSYTRVFNSNVWSAWTANLVADDIIPISNGGTGATTVQQARINLGVQNITNDGTTQTTISSPDGQTLLVVPNAAGNWGVLRWNGSGYVNAPLGIAGGGTGASSVAAARTNFGLGSEQSPSFVNLQLVNNNTGSGLLMLNRNVGTTLDTQTRIYNEFQNSLSKTTINTVNVKNGKSVYLQYDENANLTGVNEITASGIVRTGSIVNTGVINSTGAAYVGGLVSTGDVLAAQGKITGVDSTSGGNKKIFLQNISGDGSVNNWVNLLQGNWYNGYWQLGAIRGAGTDIDMVQLGVNNMGNDWKSFQFRNSYGGHFVTPRGIKGQSFAAGWITPSQYMGSTFWADRVANNDNGYVPIVSGASSSTGGYSTTGSFGIISGGSANWPSMALAMVGDGTYLRGYTFDMGGNISTFDSPGGIFGGSFIFSRAATSDRNLKHDIVYTDGKESYDRVMQWLPTMFKYNGQETQRYGLIAQDLQDIDPQYVKRVKGGPIMEQVEELDEETGEMKTVSKDTGEYAPDTLALDNNVLLTDLACAFKYSIDKQEKEIAELKEMINQLLNK